MRTFRLLLPLAAFSLLGAAPDPGPIGTSFHRLDRGRITPATLPTETSTIVVYYGAGWCGPCRAFVPELLAAYPELRRRGVEVLFVSDDATCAGATEYARTGRMPWLLLPCDRQRHGRLRRLGGKALPGIVVLDREGRLIGSSWRADGSSVPRRTLRELLRAPG